MAYIYLDDLKKILPGILDSWIDEDDESWEWIFQEIEQKCHIGKKGKKKKKFDKRVDIDALINKFQQMDKDLKQAINNNTQLGLSMKDMGAEIRHIREDVKSAKSMAETAKQRTEVDYSKYSGKSDGKVSYSNSENKDCKSCKYYCGAYEHCVTCKEYEHWEARENE